MHNEAEVNIDIENEQMSLLSSSLLSKRYIFNERSRMYCCSLFTFMLIIALILFYIFDVVKYNTTCDNKRTGASMSKTLDICDVVPISMITKIVFIGVVSSLIIIGIYCTGSTIITISVKDDLIEINKKKLFIMPNKCRYKLSQLKECRIEGDFAMTGNNVNSISLSNSLFLFSNLVLIFHNGEEVNIGLGRDCFGHEKKEEIKQRINDYLKACKKIKLIGNN